MSHAQLLLFKRDLRVFDHRPLVEALKFGPVTAFYSFEPEYLAQPETQPCHLQFIIESLQELAQELHQLRIPFVVFQQSILRSSKEALTSRHFGVTRRLVLVGHTVEINESTTGALPTKFNGMSYRSLG